MTLDLRARTSAVAARCLNSDGLAHAAVSRLSAKAVMSSSGSDAMRKQTHSRSPGEVIRTLQEHGDVVRW
jgi:hypothetical protein